MIVAFYTSGHGFGHATRDAEVARALLARQPHAHVVVRTTAPAWLFERPGVAIHVQRVESDTGVSQIDAIRLDQDETARHAARFYTGFEARAAAEASVLDRMNATVVVGDIPPLAFAAAARAGRPSIALGNFTWDWVYAAYPGFDVLAPGVLQAIRWAYGQATAALRLPLHGGFEPMRERVRDIPFIARTSGLGRRRTRERLAIGDDLPLVLASFGGFGLALPYETAARNGGFRLLVADDTTRPAAASDLVRPLSRGELAACGLRYEDLVAAADVVVSKPGYWIVSECLANGASLLYTSRGPFAEQEVFVAEMPRVLRCRPIAAEDLVAGRWGEGIDALLRQPLPAAHPETNGADVAAEAIIALA
jgi:L-arabinokinase